MLSEQILLQKHPKGTADEKGLYKLYKLYQQRDEQNINAAAQKTFNKLQTRMRVIDTGKDVSEGLAHVLPKYAEIIQLEGKLRDPSEYNKKPLLKRRNQLLGAVEKTLPKDPELAQELNNARNEAGKAIAKKTEEFKATYNGNDRMQKVQQMNTDRNRMFESIQMHEDLVKLWGQKPSSNQKQDRQRSTKIADLKAGLNQPANVDHQFGQAEQNKAFGAGFNLLQDRANRTKQGIIDVDRLHNQYDQKKQTFKLQNSNQQKRQVSQKSLEL